METNIGERGVSFVFLVVPPIVDSSVTKCSVYYIVNSPGQNYERGFISFPFYRKEN